MGQYRIRVGKNFSRTVGKLIKKAPLLEKRIDKTLGQLSINPYHPGLKTHIVNTKKYGKLRSSRVTGDLRIVWNILDEGLVILVIDPEGHEIYK